MANALNATLAKRSRNGAVLAGSVAAAMAGMALWNTYRARKLEREHPPCGRFVTVDGVRLHYLERGGGRPVVFLHGNVVTAEASLWCAQLPACVVFRRRATRRVSGRCRHPPRRSRPLDIVSGAGDRLPHRYSCARGEPVADDAQHDAIPPGDRRGGLARLSGAVDKNGRSRIFLQYPRPIRNSRRAGRPGDEVGLGSRGGRRQTHRLLLRQPRATGIAAGR